MVKRKVNLHIKLILSVLLISIFISSINNSSYAVDMFGAKRTSNMSIVSNNEAYIGIQNSDVYTVNAGNKFTITIKNNLPSAVNYNIDIQAPYITKIEPNEFTLGANGESQQVTVYVNKNNVQGSYDTKGTIHAKWDNGSSDVFINFKTIINLNNN